MKYVLVLLAFVTLQFTALAQNEGSLKAEEFRFYQDLRSSIHSYTLSLQYGATVVEQWIDIPDPTTNVFSIQGIAPKVYRATLYAFDEDWNILFYDSIEEVDFTSGHADISFVLKATEEPWHDNSGGATTASFEFFNLLNEGFYDSFGKAGAVSFEDIPLKRGDAVRFYVGNAQNIDIYRYDEIIFSVESQEISFDVIDNGLYTVVATGKPNWNAYIFMEIQDTK